MPATAIPKKRAASRPAKAKVKVQGVTPFLWFQKGAGEAARYYVSLIQGSKIKSEDPMSVAFNLGGQDLIALNGGPSYALTPAFSIFVTVKTQDEVDALWNELTSRGGEESRCGWLVDRFGVSWQIIPEKLSRLLYHKDPNVAKRTLDAMLKMQKIDIATLEKAAKGR